MPRHKHLDIINNLQVLRAFAALVVTVFHIFGTAASYGQPSTFGPWMGNWGESGVDLFFVVSGFVMAYTQARRPKTPGQFISHRLRRVVPLYWLFTLLILILYVFLPQAFRALTVDTEFALASFFFTSNLILDKHPLVHVGWTLEYEMLFYGLFAASLLIPHKKYPGWPAALALITLAVTELTSWFVMEFTFGMACAWYLRQKPDLSFGKGLLGIGVVLYLATLWIIPETLSHVIYWGLPATLIVLGACTVPQLQNRLALYLGRASYSLYLVQVLTIPAFYKASSALVPALHADMLALLCFLMTVLSGLVVYHTLEAPLKRTLQPKLIATKRRLRYTELA